MQLTPASFPGPRAFARHCLKGGAPLQPMSGLRWGLNGVGECVIFRESCWQVGLISMPPGLTIPRHRHNRASTADLCLSAGDSVCTIDGKTRINTLHGSLAANLLLLPRGVWHEGDSGPGGAMFLSFQQWLGEPGFLLEDWEE